MFGVLLLEGARDYARNGDADPMVLHDLEKYYSSLFITIYTLTRAISGGMSWRDCASPFDKISWMYSVAFTLFVSFVLFGLLNILTGVFVESASAIADIDRDFVIQEEMNNQSSMVNVMRELFHRVDKDSSGGITWHELKTNLEDPAMKAYFKLVQLEPAEAESLFYLLDVDDDGEVGIEEFIMGCMRLKGTAKCIDSAMLLYENKRIFNLLNNFMRAVETNFEQLHGLISDMRARKQSLKMQGGASPGAVNTAIPRHKDFAS